LIDYQLLINKINLTKMFSRPLILSAIVSSAIAKSLLPSNTDKIAFKKATSFDYAENLSCAICLLGGFEYVFKDKADYKPIPFTTKPNGLCCIPSSTSADSCPSLGSRSNSMQSSRDWMQYDIALANCPNDKSICGAVQEIDLDKSPEIKKDITVGASAVKMS
jgi:hypothetical protein